MINEFGMVFGLLGFGFMFGWYIGKWWNRGYKGYK